MKCCEYVLIAIARKAINHGTDKHSSLLVMGISDEEKSFVTIIPGRSQILRNYKCNLVTIFTQTEAVFLVMCATLL